MKKKKEEKGQRMKDRGEKERNKARGTGKENEENTKKRREESRGE